MEQHKIDELRTVIQHDLDRELQCKFPSYHTQFPEYFREAVVKDVFDTSAWRDEGKYSQDDISLAIQREVLVAVKLHGEEQVKGDCLSCSASLSADEENGEQYLVCSIHGYQRVPEDGYCDEYS